MTDERKAELFDRAIAWIWEHTENFGKDAYISALKEIGYTKTEITDELISCNYDDLEKGKFMNRYFYILEADNLGNKQIRMECNIYGNQNEGFHFNEWVGCIVSIGEAQTLIKQDEFYSTLDEIVKYSGDVTEGEANAIYENYFDGTSGEELKITDITSNTPCGDYYFDAE